MHLRKRFQFSVAIVFFSFLGCQSDLPIPVQPPKKDPSDQWKTLLDQSVSADGVDWANIEANRQILEQYVAWVGTVGPQSNRRNDTRFPRRGRANHKLVHWVNAYNAWMIYSYLHHNKPTDLGSINEINHYLKGQRIFIDGEYTSFSHVKHERILADYQEPRLHFMLYELTEQSPHPRFWTSTMWKAKSNLTARKFMASGRGAVKVQTEWQFHPMFKTYQKDFIDWSEHDTLCEYLFEYTTGELQMWIEEANHSGCNLTFFPSSKKIPVGSQYNSPAPE